MHFPVLLKEVIESLDLRAGSVVVDATLGGGGHARRILEAILPGGRLIAIDSDPEAIKRVKSLLKGFESAVTYVNDDFRNIDKALEESGIKQIDGAVFDLGMSSFQVDDERRGFSFLKDGPLDMRFDPQVGLSAKDVVNTFTRDELAEIIKSYGEERHAKLIAGELVKARKEKRIETTGELARIVKKAAGGKYRSQKLNPAARTFQALRICVNDELSSIEEAVDKTIFSLSAGGRICVISFHSLEDRIIKNIFRDMAKRGELNILTKKPVTPTKEEIRVNTRSRSAKLRVAERV